MIRQLAKLLECKTWCTGINTVGSGITSYGQYLPCLSGRSELDL